MKLYKVISLMSELAGSDMLEELDERYNTINTYLKIEANKFFDAWVNDIVGEVRSYKNIPFPVVTKYDCIAAYLINNKENGVREFERTITVGKYQVKIRLMTPSKTDENRKLEGYTDTSENPVVSCIHILPKDINSIVKFCNEKKRVPYKFMKTLFTLKKGTIVHEITHYIQDIKDELNVTQHELTGVLEEYKNLKLFAKFLYFVEDHELYAKLNEAYKLYCDSIFFDIKGDFYNFLGYAILRGRGFKNLSNKVLKNEISPEGVIETLKKSPITRFLFVWFVFCFTPKNSKFSRILFKGESPDLGLNLKLIDQNKENIYNFFNKLTPREIKNLDFMFAQSNMFSVASEFFSLEHSNKPYLENLKGILEIKGS